VSEEQMRGLVVAFFLIVSLFDANYALAVKAIAHCSATGRFGLGEGDTAAEAADDAVSKCIVGGGIAGCCHLLGSTEDAECVALATGPGVQKGFGSARDQGRAERIAIQECGGDCRLRISQCEND
jgi:hypothetical protein